MIEVIPALDIMDGQVVRLVEGDFARRTDYASDPVKLAVDLATQGFRRLHLVDLDGARAGRVVHAELLTRMAATSGLAIDFGGGLRAQEDVALALSAGATQVNLGSVAIRQPELFDACLDRFGADAIILAADARDGNVAAAGWLEQTDMPLSALIERFICRGLKWALVTDIARDGTLTGPSLALYRELLAAFPTLNIIASGGVANMADIVALDQLSLPRVVVGKALLEGRVTAVEVMAHAG
jgi:phosphoribosylformimino-5-aminoimidazole carboxamide ribotide isomerase